MHGSVQVTNMSGLDGLGVELGLDDELAARDGTRIVGNAVHSPIAAGLIELGVEAHLGEQVLDEGFELLGVKVEQVGAFVDVGDDVHGIDNAGVGHAERHDRLDGDQFVRMGGNVGVEVTANAFDGLELRFVEHQRGELFPGSPAW